MKRAKKPAAPEPRIMIVYGFEDENGKIREARTAAEKKKLDKVISDAEKDQVWPVVWARMFQSYFERWSKDSIPELAERGRLGLRFAQLLEETLFAGVPAGIGEPFSELLHFWLQTVDDINKPMLDLAKKRYDNQQHIRLLVQLKHAESIELVKKHRRSSDAGSRGEATRIFKRIVAKEQILPAETITRKTIRRILTKIDSSSKPS